jgi:paREP15, putative coiled-coil protein
MTEKDFQRIQELLTTSLNATEARNAERFDKIDKRLDGVERRLDKLEHEIKDVRSSMEESFDAIGAQFNEIDNRFAELDEKIDRNHQEVTTRIDALSKDIEAQGEESLRAQGALKLLNTQHENLASRVAVVEGKLQAA